MAEELQDLLNRINGDYLAQAEKEKNALIAKAEIRAKEIVAQAESDAAARLAEAESSADNFRKRAEAAARQSARDIVLTLRNELEMRLENAVGRSASAALTPDFMAAIIREMAASAGGDATKSISVLCAKKDAAALSEALRGSLRDDFKADGHVFVNSGIRSGMQLSIDGSELYFDFTDSAVKDLLKSYVTAEIGKLFDDAE